MAILRLTGFTGEIPAAIPRALPNNAAQQAINTRLNDGGLTPIREPRFVTAPDGYSDQVKTIYKHEGDWLIWDKVVNVTQGAVAQERLYITGDGVPKMRIGSTTYPLSVPSPTNNLTAVVSGSSDSDLGSTRVYVYTNVTEFGEESEPSPISDGVYWEPDQTVTLSGFQLSGQSRGVNRQRIYRSQTSISGTTLYFIAERPASTDDFTDNVPSNEINEPIPSMDWNKPVDDLQGLISLPNGLMAAFSGKDIYFSEPFRPHAWPVKYMLTVDYPIVGLGAFGSSVAVLTKGNPYIISGGEPSMMIMEKLELNLPCLNAQGIQDLGYAVAYPSHDGLALVSQSGARLATESMFTKVLWQELTPESFVSGQYDGRYFAAYQYYDRVEDAALTGTLIISPSGDAFVSRANIEPIAMHYSIEDGLLYYADKEGIWEWDSPAKLHTTQYWVSKEFIVPKPKNFGAIYIDSNVDLSDRDKELLQEEIDDIIEQNKQLGDLGACVNGNELNECAVNCDAQIELPQEFNVSVTIYADKKLIASISKVNKMVRLPAGFLARSWVIAVSSDIPINDIALASTGAELAGTP